MVQIANERIDKLFSLAEQCARAGDLARAGRYASLAWKIGTRYNVRLPVKYRIFFCRKCKSYLAPGKNSRVRLNNGIRHVRCDGCGCEYRMPYRKGRTNTAKEA